MIICSLRQKLWKLFSAVLCTKTVPSQSPFFLTSTSLLIWMDHHVSRIYTGFYYRLHQLWRLRRSLDSDSLATLVYTVVNSRIDYCNTVLAGAPRTVTDKLQHVLNVAARIVTGTLKCDQGLGQILHDELHWLIINDRVFFKLAVTVHWCLNGRTPPYLSDTASRSLVLTLGGICVPPTDNYLQYFATASALMAVVPFQLPAPKSGTLCRISAGTQPSVQTVSDVCLKRICSLNTGAFSALEVLDDNRAIQIHLLTYLLNANNFTGVQFSNK